MKLIIAGPPHSGKSVFISALDTAFTSGEIAENGENLYGLKLDATPDGETNYVKENYHDEELVKSLRKKGHYTTKLREYIRRCITNSKHPLMMIDIGGKFNDNDKSMLENATHAIILSGGKVVSGEKKGQIDFGESISEWTEFFKSMNIPVLCSVYSDFYAQEDYTTPDGHLAVHHLERSDLEKMGKVKVEALNERPNIKQVAKIILGELKKTGELGDLVEISKYKERKDECESESGKIVTFDGAYSGHKLAKLALDEIALGNRVEFFDRKLGAEIEIKPLQMGKTQRQWFDEPEYIGCYHGKRVYQIRTLSNHSQNILLPEDLSEIEVPKVPENSIVKIASTASQWFGAIVAASYQFHCDAVAISMPNQGISAVVWSNNHSEIAVCDENKRLNKESKGVIPDLPIVFIDMDGVLADFDKGKELMLESNPEFREKYKGVEKNMPGLFESLSPVEGAIEGAKRVAENFNAFILTSSPWNNPTGLQAKNDWIKKHFTDDSGFNPFKRKVIITHHKEQLKGDILIDDRNTNGVYDFSGAHIWFGKDKAQNWLQVMELLNDEKQN